ncbi:MAG: hypothetical protein A2Y38_26420 [Spirochaetes bacterium GWB1_59_5]|nr:MAG: hypothetical protein A2Y38_26420 [Spirochaetes bacterium GWB1_59_5]
MLTTAWKETTYDDTYSTTLRSLQRRQAEDQSFTLDAAKGQLRHLYVNDGNNWVGRGELQDIIVQAMIDAYECYIAECESKN